MSKKRTTGNSDSIECPACEATLDLSAMNVAIKGFKLKCSACEKVLITLGGMIAAVADKPIQSISLEMAGESAQSDSGLPVAPLRR